MTTTEMVQKSIEDLGEAYQSGINKVKQKTEALEERIDGILARKGTSFGGNLNNNPFGLKDEISEALNKNLVQIKGLVSGETKHLRIETKAAGDMSIGTHLTGGSNSVSSPIIGPTGMSYRFTNVRDLLRTTNMSGMYLPVLKDNGGEGTLAPVAENSTKPDIDFDLAEANAKAEVIAGTTTVSKQFFEDVQNARTWLVDRLVELYNSVEADQLLNGDGVSPNLKGLNTSSNYTAATGLATIPVEKLIQGILQMRLLKRRASGIIINAANLEELLLNKAAGSLEYDLPNIVNISPLGQLTILGTPVLDVAEQPADTFTIHDNTGSLYAVRQGITIEFFNEIYAKTNKILIRIESRVAFPNFGASYTVKGTF